MAARKSTELQQTLKQRESELQALTELIATSRQRIAELEAESERKKNEYHGQARSLAAANVNSARLIAEIEEKNGQLEQLLRELDKKNNSLEEAHLRLENSFDDVKKQHALQEIERKRMETELETARVVQAMLIPDQVRSMDGFDLALSYRAASECGGDWLGFFEDPEKGKVAILIGDVTGHGVGSALMTAGVFSYFSTIRTLRGSGNGSGRYNLDEPVEILDHLDQVISAMGKSKTFMTLFASVIDLKSKSIRFSNAGHCFPYVITRKSFEQSRKRASRRATMLSVPGKILGSRNGVDLDAVYESRDAKLDTDDVIFWYTDGIIENRNSAGEEIGERRLRRWLFELWEEPVEQIKKGLDSRIDEFLGGVPLEDDIAFIVAKIA